MNHENILAVAVGIILTAASFLAKGISSGMPPHRHKPIYPATRLVRVVLLCVGLLFALDGIDRIDAQVTDVKTPSAFSRFGVLSANVNCPHQHKIPGYE